MPVLLSMVVVPLHTLCKFGSACFAFAIGPMQVQLIGLIAGKAYSQ
jgi:hypothetical protein